VNPLFSSLRRFIKFLKKFSPAHGPSAGRFVGSRSIGWIVYGSQAHLTAGYRYYCYIPAGILGGAILVYEKGMDPEAFLDQHQPDALILGKAFGDAYVDLARAAETRGIPVLATMTDWHFDDPVNRQLCKIASRVVVQTEMMAAAIRQHFRLDPIIIEEPYEGPRVPPKFSPGEVVRLLWYGHSSNLDTLETGIAQIGRTRGKSFRISIVTENVEMARQLLDGLPKSHASIQFETHPFSLDRQWEELKSCDAVILPSLPVREKMVKGHGRLVQAIHSGRLAIAFSLPQYEELAGYCWCGEDLGDGLAWALDHPSEVVERLVLGQAYIDERFAPARIARRWGEEIDHAIGHG